MKHVDGVEGTGEGGGRDGGGEVGLHDASILRVAHAGGDRGWDFVEEEDVGVWAVEEGAGQELPDEAGGAGDEDMGHFGGLIEFLGGFGGFLEVGEAGRHLRQGFSMMGIVTKGGI